MRNMPFLVTHEELKEPEGYEDSLTRRYLVWAESPLEAVRKVLTLKLERGRALPNKYDVFGLRQPDMEAHEPLELNEDDATDLDWDLEMFEGLFGSKQTVLL